jgi:Transposase, Mutator family
MFDRLALGRVEAAATVSRAERGIATGPGKRRCVAMQPAKPGWSAGAVATGNRVTDPRARTSASNFQPNTSADAATPEEIEARRRAFIRKWRLKHDSLEEAGDRLFTFTCLPPSQWRSARTTNAIERLHEEFKRRVKTQTVLPSADTPVMLFWALLASGQINMRKVGRWLADARCEPHTWPPETITSCYGDPATKF